MSIIAFISMAIAFGISTMLLMHRCASATPIRLSEGLLVAAATAVMHSALFLLGFAIGDTLRFEDASGSYVEVNALVMLGTAAVVAFKWIGPYLRREPRLPVFALNGGTVRTLLMALATGINASIVGIGVGFVAPLSANFHGALWPMLLSTLLLAYLGIMFGRQHVTLRPRRWMIIATILLLGVAIHQVVLH